MTDAVSEVVEQLEIEIGNLRSLITDLRPAALDDLGIEAAIEDLAERARSRGLDVDVNVDLAFERGRARDRLTAEIETAVYRIVQEGLTNATKHGFAQHARLEIDEDDATVRVTVRDDGQGFDPAERTSGFGLLGMRERTELLAGTLEIESEPGQGATVKAALPARHRHGARAA